MLLPLGLKGMGVVVSETLDADSDSGDSVGSVDSVDGVDSAPRKDPEGR